MRAWCNDMWPVDKLGVSLSLDILAERGAVTRSSFARDEAPGKLLP
jgi:hypothetical protein